jgi:beta-N-acetylhexosaminidase
MGFKGVAISDALEMLAIWDVYGFERGTILAINAGIDILLYCNESGIVPYSDDRGPETVQVVLDAIARGEIAESRINEACGRILALKSRHLA